MTEEKSKAVWNKIGDIILSDSDLTKEEKISEMRRILRESKGAVRDEQNR